MKRIVSSLMVLMLILGTFTTAFAQQNGKSGRSNVKIDDRNDDKDDDKDDDGSDDRNNGKSAPSKVRNMDKAKVLYDLKLFSGVSKTEFVPNLEDGATRAEALVMVGNALGWLKTMTDAEKSITSVPGYADVPSWAAPYVKYAVDHNITKGIGHGKFGANLPVNERMIYSWYARALLYTQDVWSNPYLLVDIGMISKDQAESILAMKAADRDTLVGILFSAMQWKEKGSNMRLIQKLVNRAWVNKNTAEEAGLLEPATKTMTFSLSALSLKSVRIDFPYVLKASSVEKDNLNVQLTAKPVAPATIGLTTPVDISAYSLVVVDKSIYVFLNAKQEAGTVLSIEVKADAGGAAIESVSGHKAAPAVKSVPLNDTTAPSVKDVKAVSPRILEIIFSEPMDSLPEFILARLWIDGVVRKASTPDSPADSAVFNTTRTILSVTLQTDLSEGPHPLDVEKGLLDDSGIPSTEGYSKNLMIDFDKTAPSVVSVKVEDPDDVVVTFSEDIKANGSIRVEGTEYPILASMVTGKEVAVHMIAPFTKEVEQRNHLLIARQITDLEGNRRDSETFVYTFVPDNTAPQAIVTVVSQGVLKVEFSEEINKFNMDDYLLTSDDTVPVSLASTVEYFAAVGTAKAYAVITMTVPTTTATTVRLTLNPSDATPVLDESINQNPFETKTDEYEFVIPVWYTETTSADYGRGYGEIGFYVIGGCTLMISKLTGSILQDLCSSRK